MSRLLLLFLCLAAGARAWCGTAILGEREASAQQMADFVLARNPDFDPSIAEVFADLGDLYGIRGDVAFCQAVRETGWFRYQGSAVAPDHHNYCGLGVVRNGQAGCRFATVADGVRAMMQHLWAYATTAPLPGAEDVVDPRYGQVRRGSAPSWEDLSGRWAADPSYGDSILSLYRSLLKTRRASEPE